MEGDARQARGSQRAWRFVDGPTTSVSRVVPAAPEDVWQHVSDIEFPVDGSPELQRVEWLEGHEELVPGARFVGHNARGDLTWSVVCEVTVLDAPRTFVWTPLYRPDDPEDPEPLATWRFDLEPVDDGTRVTQSVTLGPGRSGLTWAIRQRPDAEERIIARRLADLEDSMTGNLERLEQLASGDRQ